MTFVELTDGICTESNESCFDSALRFFRSFQISGFTSINRSDDQDIYCAPAKNSEGTANDTTPASSQLRTNGCIAAVSKYLGLDAHLPTKKAAQAALKDHPLAVSLAMRRKAKGRTKKRKRGSSLELEEPDFQHDYLKLTHSPTAKPSWPLNEGSAERVSIEQSTQPKRRTSIVVIDDSFDGHGADLEALADESDFDNPYDTFNDMQNFQVDMRDDSEFDLEDSDLMALGDAIESSNQPRTSAKACILNEQQLVTPVSSDTCSPCISCLEVIPVTHTKGESDQSDEGWNTLDDDNNSDAIAEMIDLTIAIESGSQVTSSTSIPVFTQSGRTQMPSTPATSNMPALLIEESITSRRAPQIPPPFAQPTRHPTKSNPTPPPSQYRAVITRKPFPTHTKDRSPVSGLSADAVLRTCFRIGEALNEGCQAVRLGRDMLIELYARVIESRSEENSVQRLQLHDCFHDRPPFLDAVLDDGKDYKLWSRSANGTMMAEGSGTLCKLVGKMRRRDLKWEFAVLNTRQVSWNDVEYVAGIYSA